MEKKDKKNDIIARATTIAVAKAKPLKLSIIDVDYVYEHGINILRIIAEGEKGLTIDDATLLNNQISEALDVEDFIEDEYYLEVSSPGIERELKKDEDIKKAIGQYICIKTYEKLYDSKELYGYLLTFENGQITIELHQKGRKKIVTIPQEKISKIRLAIKF